MGADHMWPLSSKVSIGTYAQKLSMHIVRMVGPLWQQISRGRKKTFLGDLLKINDKLRRGENFSLVRFNDGEMSVINGDAINLANKYHGDPNRPSISPVVNEMRITAGF